MRQKRTSRQAKIGAPPTCTVTSLGAPGARRVIYISPRGLCESIQTFLRPFPRRRGRKRAKEPQRMASQFFQQCCQCSSRNNARTSITITVAVHLPERCCLSLFSYVHLRSPLLSCREFRCRNDGGGRVWSVNPEWATNCSPAPKLLLVLWIAKLWVSVCLTLERVLGSLVTPCI